MLIDPSVVGTIVTAFDPVPSWRVEAMMGAAEFVGVLKVMALV